MRVKNAAPPTTMTPIAAAATMRASSSAPSRSPSHAKALVCSSVRLPTSETTANAASTPLRASVFQLAGAECSWPKQWQSGARPRARLTAMATLKIASSARAPMAPYTAVLGQRSKPATVSSASGRISASAPADHSGASKATTALRVPVRSASFVAAATAKTAARTRLEMSATAVEGRAQMPPLQTPDSQTLPQLPQFFGSLCVSAQPFLQHVVPPTQHGYLADSNAPMQATSPLRQQMSCALSTQTGPLNPRP